MLNFIKSKLPTPVRLWVRSLTQLDHRDLIIWINWAMGRKLPRRVKIDASSLCQLHCGSCAMRIYNYGDRGKGYLKFDDFARFLKMNSYVREIELSNHGEIFLNPDLPKIIEYAHSKKVKLTAWNGVNFNTVSDKVLETLVKCKFYGVNIAIDGASQEVYSQYRGNGNFDKVINNIKKLNEYKEKYNSPLPLLNWQYIILECSEIESEIKKAKEMAKELNCRIFFIKDHAGFIPKNAKMIERETNLCYENKNNVLSRYTERNVPCVDLWKFPQINYDGRLFGCSNNTTKDFGVNVFEIGLRKSLNSKIVKHSKKMLTGKKICEESPCDGCYIKNFVLDEKLLTKMK